jgi:hypothetical protein
MRYSHILLRNISSVEKLSAEAISIFDICLLHIYNEAHRKRMLQAGKRGKNAPSKKTTKKKSRK